MTPIGMKLLLFLSGLLPFLTSSLYPETPARHYWPQWRGPLGTGVAPDADPPLEWSEDKNIRWKIALPGKGHSTPVVWKNRLFLTTAVPFGPEMPAKYSGWPNAHDEVAITHRIQFKVMAINRQDGNIVWQKILRQELPHAGGHSTASLASNSPLTDGQHLFAFFGSFGLYCLNLDGELIWETDLGQKRTLHGHGEGASPALYQDTLIINWDHEEESFVIAFDKGTGQQRWRVDRDNISSWSTPTIAAYQGQDQIIIGGSRQVISYDLASGEIIWQCGGLSVKNVVATPVVGSGMVFVGSSYDQQMIMGIRLDGAEGDISGSEHVVWSRSRGAPYVPTPLLYGEALYYIHHFQGIMTRVEARTGENRPGALRLNGLRGVFASPLGAAGRVYVSGHNGVTIVISHDDQAQILALNQLADSFSASPIAVARELYLRGEKNLYCIVRDDER